MKGFRLELVCAVGLGSASGRLRRNKQRGMQVRKAEKWQMSSRIDDNRWFTEQYIIEYNVYRK